MHADTDAPGGLAGQLLRREAARWWWAPLVAGIAWFVIAWVVLRADVTSLAAVGLLVGVVFLVAAATEVGLTALVAGGWRVVHIVLAVVFVLAAVWAFVRPINTFFALASVLGLLLLFQGVFYIARAAVVREVSPFWWIGMVCGVLVALLGLWMSASDRVWDLAARAVFILLFVGFYAVFRGINDVVLAFELRHIGREPREAAAAGGEAPQVPTQERRHVTADAQPGSQPDSASGASATAGPR
ncbi:HdeD family acid-resistance protein [Actinomycetospora straminea]|uniref:HdeD family acid-resistance protein n=1 Tax=Actinomycetospora straminea TaxID=663607 RepID=A0ABP9ESA7_9PSEU|nr:DUF308 domain-containing protein [Actinomycetospora straminea]MDD7931460.1 DUF308 domain-containing protein [Actinomycetospora straminea]